MPTQQFSFTYELLDNDTGLNEADRMLLQSARTATANAYAPYSHFEVAAAARLQNGALVQGTNQENASYPVGICAERTLLSAISFLHPNEPIDTIAISYQNLHGNSHRPASPCGLCRQSLLEYETRVQSPIRLILSGQSGQVLIVDSAKDLLPFCFTAEDLK